MNDLRTGKPTGLPQDRLTGTLRLGEFELHYDASGGNLSAFLAGAQYFKRYFEELRSAIGKSVSEGHLSEADLNKYEVILTNAEEILEDTIHFSERASYSRTDEFKAQKRALEERLGLTRFITRMMQDGSKSMELLRFIGLPVLPLDASPDHGIENQ
jgi:hypothetical protein